MDEPIDHPLRPAVMEAIGAGSTCWESGTDTGNAVFDMARATEIGNGLLATIAERETEIIKAAAQAAARCQVYLELLQRCDLILHDTSTAYLGEGLPTALGMEIGSWRSGYRATLDFPPLIELDRIATEGGS